MYIRTNRSQTSNKNYSHKYFFILTFCFLKNRQT